LRPVDRVFVRVGRRRLLYFGGCDYYRLSSDPRIWAALTAGLARHGLNVAASRITTGNHPLYDQTERAIAAFFGVERALLCPTGYLAAQTAIEGWRDQFTHAVVDERAHPCLFAGAQLAERPLIRFRHGDPFVLAAVLGRLPPRARPLVVTDGVFAHDGFLPPLARYLELLPARGWLLVDEAHGAGVLGARQRGAAELAGIDDPRLLRSSTFSKAFGVFGGAVLGSAKAVDEIAGRSRGFAGSTPLPLPLAATIIAALRIVRADAGRRGRLAENVATLKAALSRIGYAPLPGPAPIVSVAAREGAGRQLIRRLQAAGIYPSFIRYPSAAGAGHFRFAISSEHRPEHLERLLTALGRPRKTLASGVDPADTRSR
jgi:7-keto-8-aminopelargonate synthetase-like enzyme